MFLFIQMCFLEVRKKVISISKYLMCEVILGSVARTKFCFIRRDVSIVNDDHDKKNMHAKIFGWYN